MIISIIRHEQGQTDIATRCNYGAALDRIVKDKFICGVRSGHLINDIAIETSTQALTKTLLARKTWKTQHKTCQIVTMCSRNGCATGMQVTLHFKQQPKLQDRWIFKL